jgi:hypothetical protein
MATLVENAFKGQFNVVGTRPIRHNGNPTNGVADKPGYSHGGTASKR